DAPRANELFHAALGGDSPPPFELRLHTRAGGFVPVEFLSTRALVTGDRIDVMSVARDMSEIRRAEEAIRQADSLRHAKEAAEIASRAKSEFLANISHEIRTPMTAVLGFTDILLESEPGPDEARRHLQAIRQNGRYLLDLINDL